MSKGQWAVVAVCIAAWGLAAYGQEITVTSPAGGERWAVGTPVTITWTSSGVSNNIRINLVNRDGTVVGQIVESMGVRRGSRAWNVGELLSGSARVGEDYRIRIREIGSEVQGESGLFTITLGAFPHSEPEDLVPAPVLAVTAPRRTDRWCRGQPYTVGWTASGLESPTARITLRQGEREVLLLDDDAPNSGAFRWPIPVTLETGSYAVRVAAPDNSRHDDSDTFAVVSCASAPTLEPDVEVTPAGRLRVTIPAGGETWSAYDEYHIEWESPATSACGARVDITAVAMKGGTVHVIERNVLNREGRNYFLWKIGERPLGPGQFKIRLTGSAGCAADSPYFHISTCDYAIEGVTLPGGRPLSDGIDWNPAAVLEVELNATVRRYGVPAPAGSGSSVQASVRYRDGSERVVGTATISTGIADAVRLMSLRCLIPMTEVAVPMSMRLPIRLRIVSDVDRVSVNDELAAELRLLGHEPTDLKVRLDAGTLRITRLHDALPTPSHNLYIDVYAQNLTPNAAGGAPPPLRRVKCRWSLEEREDAGTWRSVMGNALYFDAVPFGSEERLAAAFGVWLDEGKQYRVKFTLDPDFERNDPHRENNWAQAQFRLPD